MEFNTNYDEQQCAGKKVFQEIGNFYWLKMLDIFKKFKWLQSLWNQKQMVYLLHLML